MAPPLSLLWGWEGTGWDRGPLLIPIAIWLGQRMPSNEGAGGLPWLKGPLDPDRAAREDRGAPSPQWEQLMGGSHRKQSLLPGEGWLVWQAEPSQLEPLPGNLPRLGVGVGDKECVS